MGRQKKDEISKFVEDIEADHEVPNSLVQSHEIELCKVHGLFESEIIEMKSSLDEFLQNNLKKKEKEMELMKQAFLHQMKEKKEAEIEELNSHLNKFLQKNEKKKLNVLRAEKQKE